MVCDKEGCDKLCVNGRWCEMVCDKVVCEREGVTKLCVKDGVWQRGV